MKTKLIRLLDIVVSLLVFSGIIVVGVFCVVYMIEIATLQTVGNDVYIIVTLLVIFMTMQFVSRKADREK